MKVELEGFNWITSDGVLSSEAAAQLSLAASAKRFVDFLETFKPLLEAFQKVALEELAERDK